MKKSDIRSTKLDKTLVDSDPPAWYNLPMIKTSPTSSTTTILPKGCIYRVNGYINSRVKYHIVNRRNEMVAYGYRTYDEAVAKAIEMYETYKVAKKAAKSFKRQYYV